MDVVGSMHPDWLSKAYLVFDEPGGTAVFVDSGAPLEPLLAAVDKHGLTVTHLLTTHGHEDHVAGHDALVSRFGCPVVTGAVETGGLHIEALATPGHSPDGVAFVVNGEAVFTGDTLFKNAVGGGDYETVKHSVMNVLMALPRELRVYPGHTEETTIGDEWQSNPFVRVWSGAEPEGTEPCTVAGDAATLIVWSPDYDGKGKAWVRFADGRDAIVGGSKVERRGKT
jgi:glyoxylase-like metal-dependent hydrolase (beta-lactamase superfamily II)